MGTGIDNLLSVDIYLSDLRQFSTQSNKQGHFSHLPMYHP